MIRLGVRPSGRRGLGLESIQSESESDSEMMFITAVPITKLCAWGEEDSGGHHQCAMRYDEPRLVWTSLTTTHL
jgi:hypothetical protein